MRFQCDRTAGPSKAAAELEASKSFMKRLCDKYNIPVIELLRLVVIVIHRVCWWVLDPKYLTLCMHCPGGENTNAIILHFPSLNFCWDVRKNCFFLELSSFLRPEFL